jgi:hypothetical protein
MSYIDDRIKKDSASDAEFARLLQDECKRLDGAVALMKLGEQEGDKPEPPSLLP